MWGGGMAQKALDLATDVKAAQAAHEQLCLQRQGTIIKDLAEVKDFLKKAFWALLVAAATIIYDILRTRGIV